MSSATLHRAGLGDSADVVASEIDEHDVFGALLRIVAQLLLEARVVLGGAAASPRAGDRAHLDLGRRDADQDLGRAPHDRLGDSRWYMYGDGLITRSAR